MHLYDHHQSKVVVAEVEVEAGEDEVAETTEIEEAVAAGIEAEARATIDDATETTKTTQSEALALHLHCERDHLYKVEWGAESP